jgi:hypothetical protein
MPPDQSSVALPGAAGPDFSGAGPTPGLKHLGPMTTGLLLLLIGYCVFYYSQVLRKSKHVKPDDLDDSTVPS